MCRFSAVVLGLLVGFGFAFAWPGGFASAAPPAVYPADPLAGGEAALLAQGEDDVDESFSSHGADTDEEMEVDSAKMPQDTTKKQAAEIAGLTKGLRWLGQSAILIEDAKTIYIDPFDLGGGLPPADLILITHDHFDHLSPADVAKITKDGTVVVTVPSALAKLPKKGTLRSVKPGDTLTVEGVRIEVVPAYNIGKQFHPRDKGYVGFILRLGGRSIYHAGDTDFIPEMKTFKVDVALLPVGGTYTMTASEAAKAANSIKPRVAIPMHYGSVVGKAEDANTFKADVKVPVVILKPEAKQAEPGKPAK